MGYRAHVCTTYQVRYSERCDFYYEDFYPLSDFFHKYTYHDADLDRNIEILGYWSESGDVWELDRRGLSQLVSQLRDEEYKFPEELEEHLAKLPARDVLADKFEIWLETGDKENEFVRVEWF